MTVQDIQAIIAKMQACSQKHYDNAVASGDTLAAAKRKSKLNTLAHMSRKIDAGLQS